MALAFRALLAMSWLLLPAAAAADLSLSTGTLGFQVSGSELLPPPPLVVPPPQYAYLSATGNALSYSTTVTTASNVRWLKVSPASGTAPLAPSAVLLKIEVDLSVFSGQTAVESYIAANCPATPTSFGPTCRDTVTISAPGTAPCDIAVTVSYLTPVFSYALTPTELNFTFQSGGAPRPLRA